MSQQVSQTQAGGTIPTDSSQHGLNGYLELIYIKEGNRMFTEQTLLFNSLLTSTSQAIDVINSLNNLRNSAIQQNTIPSFEDFAKDYNGWYDGKQYSNDDAGDTQYLKDWKDARDAYNAMLSTTPPYYFGYNNEKWTSTSPGFLEWVDAADVYRKNLDTTIKNLSAQMSADQRNDPSSLYAKLKAVQDTLPPEPSKDFTEWSNWVLDGWNNSQTAGAGKIKQALDAADTAATNFLNQTTQNLQIFQNLLAEYYKSCSALLKATNDGMLSSAKKIG